MPRIPGNVACLQFHHSNVITTRKPPPPPPPKLRNHLLPTVILPSHHFSVDQPSSFTFEINKVVFDFDFDLFIYFTFCYFLYRRLMKILILRIYDWICLSQNIGILDYIIAILINNEECL
jgi:hypothetical protein